MLLWLTEDCSLYYIHYVSLIIRIMYSYKHWFETYYTFFYEVHEMNPLLRARFHLSVHNFHLQNNRKCLRYIL